MGRADSPDSCAGDLAGRGRRPTLTYDPRVGSPAAAKVRGFARRCLLGLEASIHRLGCTLAAFDRSSANRLTAQWRDEQVRSYGDATALSREEKRFYSQNGEDGILASVFARAGVTNRFFVEIGASDGSENCTRQLAECGWLGLWVEADPARVVAARNVAGRRVEVLQASVRRDNVVALLAGASVPGRPDLMVIDIDGNDWWILDSLLRGGFCPRVLVIEYNAAFRPDEWWVQRYRADRRWDRTFRHGASLLALNDLAGSFGLTLVGCDSNGVNAFFVEAATAKQVVVQSPGDAGRHYVGPWFSSSLWGHPRLDPARNAMFPMSPSELEDISVASLRLLSASRTVLPGEPVVVSAVVVNRTRRSLTSGEPSPVQLALSWRPSGDANPPWREPHRALLPVPVPPHRSRRASGWLRAPSAPGDYELTVTLVQEGVAWLDASRPGGSASTRIEVVASVPSARSEFGGGGGAIIERS